MWLWLLALSVDNVLVLEAAPGLGPYYAVWMMLGLVVLYGWSLIRRSRRWLRPDGGGLWMQLVLWLLLWFRVDQLPWGRSWMGFLIGVDTWLWMISVWDDLGGWSAVWRYYVLQQALVGVTVVSSISGSSIVRHMRTPLLKLLLVYILATHFIPATWRAIPD